MATINLESLKSRYALIKLVELALVLTTLLLARLGVDDVITGFGGGQDGLYLGCVVTGTYLIMLPIIIISLTMGEEMPWKMEVLLNLCGGIMFVTVGGFTVEDFHNASDKVKEVGLAVGSLAIITGGALLVDAAVLTNKYMKYINI